MRCCCPGPWTHAHSFQRDTEKGMAACDFVIGKTCQGYSLKNSGLLSLWDEHSECKWDKHRGERLAGTRRRLRGGGTR